jgi:hypothetical protein
MKLRDMRDDMATMRETLSDKRWNAQLIFFSVKTKKRAARNTFRAARILTVFA